MKKLLILLVLFMAGLAGVAYWLGTPQADDPAASFSLAAVEHGTMVETVSATGVIQPQETVPVGTELAGKVIEVAADFNQVVHEGDLLFRLDDRMVAQKLRQAEIAVRLSRVEIERANAARDAAKKSVEKLRELPENVSLRKDLDVAEAQLRQAEVAVNLAEVRIREAEEARSLADLSVRLTRILVPVLSQPVTGASPGAIGTIAPDPSGARSPRKYLVLDRKVELNQQIGPPLSAQAFLLAGDLSQMQVHAQVAEGDIGRVRIGQRAAFTVPAYGDDIEFTGRVADTRLLPTTEQGAIFYKSIIEVANIRDPVTNEWQLRPGMTASVDIVIRKHERVWKLPVAALNVEIPEGYLTAEARERLAAWQSGPDREEWKPVWLLRENGKPWPIRVRTGGWGRHGEPGIREVQHCEVLDWDEDLTPVPDPAVPETYPRVIVGVPVTNPGSFFSLPKVKL
jgi:HlyD family secretion protein